MPVYLFWFLVWPVHVGATGLNLNDTTIILKNRKFKDRKPRNQHLKLVLNLH